MATPALTANEQRMLDDDKAYGYTACQSQQLYNGYAQYYEREGSIHEDEIQMFREVAQLQQGESVLDLGCGNGVLTLGAKKLVVHGNVVGVDISDKMLGYAKKRMTEGMRFVWGCRAAS
jgi:ubiquinone/menaquinone biosynthesis C-methylase UbiE